MDNQSHDPPNPPSLAPDGPVPLSLPQQPTQPEPTPGNNPGRLPKMRTPGPLLAGGVFLVVGLLAGFLVGHYALAPPAKTVSQDQSTPEAKQLEIPREATVIAECAVGRGKQYVLPKDIPTGPVYNVWNNKVIGVEFMVGRDELLNENKTYVNLPLGGVAYDHVNIGLLSQGHAGYNDPHYHVDLFTVSHDEAQKITCK